MKHDLIKRNKSRKSKCDFIAKELDERNIEWHFKDEGGIFKFESLNDHLADNIHENLVILSGDAHALKCMAQLKIGSFEKSFGSGDTCVVLEEKHAFTVVSLLDDLLNGTGTHTNTLFTKELRESISAQVRQKAIQFLNQDLAV